MTDKEVPSTLPGQWLPWTRAGWYVLAALALGLLLLALPDQFARRLVVCDGPACGSDQLNQMGFQQLQMAGLSLGFYAVWLGALDLLVGSVYLIVGGLIFWRRSNDWFGIFASLALILFGLNLIPSKPFAIVASNPGLFAPYALWAVLANVAWYTFFYLFPNGRFVPGWLRWLVPVIVLREALVAFLPDAPNTDWFLFLEILSAIFAVSYRYWRLSDPIQRQQTKWAVFGSAVGGAGFLCVLGYFSLPGVNNSVVGLNYLIGISLAEMSLLLIPLSIGMAILRSHLWDIDLLIRRTLIYGGLTALLALVYFGAVVALQALFTALTGSARSELVTVLSTLVIAALFVPLRRRLQALIDRRFYRRKYDAARTLAQFGANLRDEVELDDLSAHLLAAVDETMQPESVELWLAATHREGQTK